MPDWIPRDENEFDILAQKFTGAVTNAPTAYGLTTNDATTLTAAQTDWDATLAASRAADTAAQAATQAKLAAREALTVLLRSDGARIQANPAVTDAQRESAGLPVHKTSRTPVPPPTTAPVLSVNGAQRLAHIISWRDAATPTSKARPKGVAGLALYQKIGGAAPADLDECRPLGLITRSPNLEEFDAADAGKVAYYLGHWVNTTGEAGPVSAVASATIAALT